jgi:hypothetical protein
VGLGIVAPVAVPVELRSGSRRRYRLSSDLGMDALLLARPAPFDVREPLDARFWLPDTPDPLTLRVEVFAVGDEDEGGRGLRFVSLKPEVKSTLARYISERLGLPVSPLYA